MIIIDEVDTYTQKKIKDRDLSRIFSLIPQGERILFISERISNKKLVNSIRILFFVLMFIIFTFLFNFIYSGWIYFPIVSVLPYIGLFAIPLFLIGFLIPWKYFNFRRDSYIILTYANLFTILFSKKKKKSPILNKYPLWDIHYFSIQKQLFRKSATLIFVYERDINETFFTIQNSKLEGFIVTSFTLKGIKDFVILQEYLESILFHFGKAREDWLSKAKYSVPLKLNISKGEYYKVKKRLKHISLGFGIATPILILIGVLIVLSVNEIFDNIFDKIGAVSCYAILTLVFYGIIANIYFPVWYPLKRCSSLEDQMIVRSNEIKYNEITLPFSKNMMVSAVFLNKWEYFQRAQRLVPSVYCIEINRDLTINEKKFFGPIEDFQNTFKFIYDHVLNWKNKNGHVFSKKELYQNEIKREN